jgi:aldehyde dehydrogenase (NAD(P)+)
MHNAGFNCIASQVLILAESWPQRAEFERELHAAFARSEARPAYYPGADSRRARIAGAGTGPVIHVDSGAPHEAFTTEAFAAVLAITTLPGDTAQSFLANAVRFANDRLAGTLGANVIIDPATQRALGPGFDDAIAALRYGAVGVNAWTGVAFLLAESTWGAYPGNTLEDIQSGIGLVHNAFLFDAAYKTVVTAPFRPFPRGLAHGSTTLLPKPPWFVTNRQAADIGRRLVEFESAPSLLKIPGLFASALRG